MSNTILVIGDSGVGKSTSLRNLDPESTFIINVLGKPLPFRGFKFKYTALSEDGMTGNYLRTDVHQSISKIIKGINEKRPDIKTLVIDDFQYTMANEFMAKALEKGFDKFTEIAKNAWEVLKQMSNCRNDLNCIVLSHSDTDVNGKVKCKTIGKLLDDKIVLEGMFTIVLHALMQDGRYKFLTQTEGNYLAKSPMGMFEDKFIDNDMQFVLEKIHNYYNEDIQQ